MSNNNSEISLTKKEVDRIKQLMERVHGNTRLSGIEEQYLEARDLEIKNTGSDVILKKIGTADYPNNLAEIPYFTVGIPTDVDWKIFDKAMAKLVKETKNEAGKSVNSFKM